MMCGNFTFRFLVVLFLLQAFQSFSQSSVRASPKKNIQDDTTRCGVLNRLIEAEDDPAIWSKYNDELKEICERDLKLISSDPIRRALKKYYAGALNNIGFLANADGNSSKALEYYLKSLKVSEEINDEEGLSPTLINIGRIYQFQGNIPKALESFSRSLKIKEKAGDEAGIAICLTSVGAIYYDQEDAPKALEYYGKALKIMEKLGDKYGIANVLGYFGIVYKNQGDPDCHLSKDECKRTGIIKALDFFSRSLKIREEIGDKYGVAASLNSIALIYKVQGDPLCKSAKEVCAEEGIKKALDFSFKSLAILTEIDHKDGIAVALNNIGELYLKQKMYDKALDYCGRSLKLSKELGYPENMRNAALDLTKLYKIKGDYKLSMENYELYVQMKDSISNEVNRKASIRSQLKYEYEKQAAADSLTHAQETEIKNAEIARQTAEIKAKRNQQYALYGGLILVIVFAGFMYNRFRITQKQKGIIEAQKQEVESQKRLIEDKQKEIVDSIRYARRIQKAVITNEKYISKELARLKK